MYGKRLSIVTASLAVINICTCANILMITMGGTKSHKIPFWELARGLIPRGHNITFMSAFPADFLLPGLEEISPAELVFYVRNFTNWDLVGARMKGDDPVHPLDMIRYGYESCDVFLSDPETKGFLYQQKKFDLLILDGAFPECALGFVHHFNVPFMYINTVGFYTGSLSLAGNPTPYSVTPFLAYAATDEMNLYQRTRNTIWHLAGNVMHSVMVRWTMQDIVRKHFGSDTPPIYELSKNVSFILQNGHATMTYPRPYLPNVAEIACIHCKRAKSLPQFPKTAEEWKTISKDFENKWNFPNCLGAVDGKHITIIPPANSGSYYWNYKGRHSIVLMAIANANYEFLMCDIGTNGRVSDGGVLENTVFYEKLTNHTLHLPAPCKIGKSCEHVPYVFIGDEAFALRSEFLKPYGQKDLNTERRIFNYRLSRARRIIENVFGIMAARFRIFHTAINLKIENIDAVVMACCILHNFLIRNRREIYAPPASFDREQHETGIIEKGLGTGQDNMTNLQRGYNRNASEEAKRIRDLYMLYFNTDGVVTWQEKFI